MGFKSAKKEAEVIGMDARAKEQGIYNKKEPALEKRRRRFIKMRTMKWLKMKDWGMQPNETVDCCGFMQVTTLQKPPRSRDNVASGVQTSREVVITGGRGRVGDGGRSCLSLD